MKRLIASLAALGVLASAPAVAATGSKAPAKAAPAKVKPAKVQKAKKVATPLKK